MEALRSLSKLACMCMTPRPSTATSISDGLNTELRDFKQKTRFGICIIQKSKSTITRLELSAID